MKISRETKWLSLFASLAYLLSGTLQPAVAQTLPIISPGAGAPPAPSALTVNLLAKARPTIFFLERASLLAQKKAATKLLRRFAQLEAVEELRAGAKLDAAAAPNRVHLDPLDSAAAAGDSVNQGAKTILSALPPVLRTPGAQAIAADRAITAENAAAFAQLTVLQDRAFNALFVKMQVLSLRRLEKIYREYSQDGDDKALRAFTVPELRDVRARRVAFRQ
jgi:hypothetical protein